jgi:cytochrome c biogenesis factor
VLLAIGIITGSMWGSASWGRYWGWDPKEVWSLVAMLGYVAILHARATGWIRAFGTALCSTLAFWLLVMTYLGVNYVLGIGLHSYGFGKGAVVRWFMIVGSTQLLLTAAIVGVHVARRMGDRSADRAARSAASPR